ncbi:MAG: CapA family protein [bacterium]
MLKSYFIAIALPSLSAQIHFDSESNILDPPSLSETISVVAVGDVMLGSWVLESLKANGVLYPFAAAKPYIQSADIAIANLEAPFTEAEAPFPKRFNFKVPPAYAIGIKRAGFDVVTLANNHTMDFGEAGLQETIETLDKIGVEHCGAGANFEQAHRPAVMDVGGKKVAFFGYSMTFPTEFYAKEDSGGTAYPEPELMQTNLAAFEKTVDFTVVSFHWSAEKLQIPKEYQIHYAHLAIDSGADLVLGHHPHVLQGLELYKNRLIAYSLGNFAFGSYSRHAVDSIMLKVHLNDQGLIYAQCVPVNVDNREVEFQPQMMHGARSAEVLSKLNEMSLHLNGGRDIIRGRGFILGDWEGFYGDWLLRMATQSYWGIPFKAPLLTEGKHASESTH